MRCCCWRRGLTLVQIALIESILIGTIFLMEVPTGMLADRVGRKWSIICSTFLLMCAEFIFIFARDYQWYVLVALLAGTGYAFASGAIEALVYDSLPPENREEAMKRAMGRVNSYGMIAFVIAPIVGGLIIGDAAVENFIPAIALTVVALLVGLLVCLTLREPPNRDVGKNREQRGAAARRSLSAVSESAAAPAGVAGRLYFALYRRSGGYPGSALLGAE